MIPSHARARGAAVAALALAALGAAACTVWTSAREGVWFAARSGAVELREDAEAPRGSPDHPRLWLVAIDGTGRDVLYELLRDGRMPELASLTGVRAHLDRSLLATLPSSTAVAWATVFTGEPPARHGIVGNEFFLRRERLFVAPVPASVGDPSDVLATFNDGLVNDLLLSPTIYERMRARDPQLRIWVAMHSVFRGADLLLMPDRIALLNAMRVMLQESARAAISDDDAFEVYESLDRGIVEAVLDQLDREPAPDVLTLYLPGADLYAHTAHAGPDAARREYLTRVVDPLIGELAAALREQGALRDRWVVVTSDHGHTRMVHSDEASLGVDGSGEPADVLRAAGFRVRPFGLGASDDEDDFQAVLAYQGGLAYVYLADRSGCAEPGRRCDWARAPRLREDVLVAADAIHRASAEGFGAPTLRDSLEMVLVRRTGDAGFDVYTGDGRTEPLSRHLAAHPRPHWSDFEERLRALAVGPAAERVGDLVLIARSGDERPLDERRYFAPPYRSYHGSPGGRDSRIPLIVAHSDRSAAETGVLVERALDGRRDQAGVARVLFELRYGAGGQRTRAER